jgi:hypothetical protein
MMWAGGGTVGLNIITNTTVQLTVPDHLRGRVMSVFITINMGVVPFGGLIVGTIASVWGVTQAITLGATLSLIVAVVARARLATITRRQAVPSESGAALSDQGAVGIVHPR